MADIHHFLLVTGGKGGVGKSTVAAGLARGLALEGRRAGMLDADLSGPNQSLLFGIDQLDAAGDQIVPQVVEGVEVVSLGAVANPDTALVWSMQTVRGTVRRLIQDVAWSDLDVLVVDLPPGSGNVHLALHELLPPTAVLLVTSGSALALADCRRQATFYRRLQTRILGVVENFAYIECPECGGRQFMFERTAVPALVSELGVPLLARLPWSPTLAYGDELRHVAAAVYDLLEEEVDHAAA